MWMPSSTTITQSNISLCSDLDLDPSTFKTSSVASTISIIQFSEIPSTAGSYDIVLRGRTIGRRYAFMDGLPENTTPQPHLSVAEA